MWDVVLFALIFLGVIVVAYLGFTFFVTRKMGHWVLIWNNVWGVDFETSQKALTMIREALEKKELTPDVFHFKQWYHDIYWNTCVILDPMMPLRMRLKYEMADMLQAELDREILYGDGGKW